MPYEFDQVIPRHNTASFKWDRYKGTDILPFWVADMDFAVAPEIVAQLAKRLEHPIFGYSNAPEALLQAVCDHLQHRYQWEIQPQWLVWLPGVVPGMAASCYAFGDSGDEVITFPPIYHHFLSLAEPAGKKLVTVPLLQQDDSYQPDFAKIEAAINPRTRLMMLCSPHNPVGRVFSREALRNFAALAEKNNTILVSDEIHCDLILDQTQAHIPTAVACPEYAERMITFMSPSKTFNLAGMNCSFAVIQNRELRKQFIDTCHGMIPMVPTLSYEAAIAAYREGDAWHQALLNYLRGNYAYLCEAIEENPKLNITPLQATYLAWINISQLNLDNPKAFFENAGVGISAGSEFGETGEDYIRFNFACPRSVLETGIDRMMNAISRI